MPSDEMVEKVARAICRAHTKSRTPSVEDVDGQVNTYWGLWVPEAEAALAAMGEREAVAADGMPATIWAGSCSALGAPDTGYWYPVRTPSTPTEYVRASPRPEAVGEAVKAERERCAKIADYGMLVPPDGGSPTQGECDVAMRIAAAIRSGT